MGNSGSSSHLPAGGNGGRRNNSEEENDANSSTSIGTAAKVGAAVAATALVAWGAWNLAASSRSEHPEDDRPAGNDRILGGIGEAGRISRGGTSGGRSLIANENYYYQPEKNYHENASRTIKFMTYNVWKQEVTDCFGREWPERIGAIGCLVQEHDPDVIFFQEVTPNFKRMFETFGWWADYDHSDSSENATEGDFCIVLSKLPIEAKGCIHTTERELPKCELDVGTGGRLYVASGHLKRPRPPAMHCKIRRAQAVKATDNLDRNATNVVFGGDMNWDEDIDGPFPLPEGWVDAWTRLKPDDVGWTYDTKSNKSLKGRNLLQRRPDRFVCKLRDFALKDIEIIGNGATPPSDHYGLLLTICDK